MISPDSQGFTEDTSRWRQERHSRISVEIRLNWSSIEATSELSLRALQRKLSRRRLPLVVGLHE
jgi:hypothetical protein